MRQHQQQPQYEFSTDEENEFEEYGIQDAAEEEVDLDAQDDDEEEDLVYEDDSDELDDGNPSQAQMPQGYQQQHLPPHYPTGQAARPQMQTTLTLNINGQPIQINQQNQHIQQQSMGMNNIAQLTNILESINPYLGAGGSQPQVNQMGDPS